MKNAVEVSPGFVEVYSDDDELLVSFDLSTESGRRDATLLAADLILQPLVIFRRGDTVRGLPGYGMDPEWATALALQILRAGKASRGSR